MYNKCEVYTAPCAIIIYTYYNIRYIPVTLIIHVPHCVIQYNINYPKREKKMFLK